MEDNTFHTVTAREENYALFASLALQEREKEEEAFVRLADNVALLQPLYSGMFLGVFNIDIKGSRSE